MKKIFFTLVILFSFFSSGEIVFGAVTINRPINLIGMVGYWTFDGKDMTPNVRDVSGNGNHANLSGQTSTTTAMGKIGQGLNFDGVNDKVVGPNLNLNTSATYAFWIKPNSNFGTSGTGIFDTKPVASGAVRLFSNTGAPAQLCWDIGGNNPDQCVFDTGYAISDWTNEWHHLVVVVSGGDTTTLYVDGVYAGSVSNSVSASSNTFDIGYFNTNFFNGVIDEVRAYGRVLSANEIKGLYNTSFSKLSETKSKGTLAGGLVGHWTFDGKDMTPNVRDVSVSGNHGNLTGQTSTSTVIGKIGQSLSFDGVNDYVSFTAPDIANSSFTISSWINATDFNARSWLSIGDQAVTNKQIHLVAANNTTLRFGFYGDDTDFTYAMNPNTWYHVVFVYDNNSGTRYLYINGIYQNSGSGGAFTGNPVGRISGWYTSPVTWDFWNGSMDDIRIYNRAFSASEITQLYSMGGSKMNDSQNTKGGTLKDGLIGLWSFDGKDMVPNIRDGSGQGNHGNLLGQTSTTTSIGKIGQVLDFDGVNDYVDMGNTSSLNLPTNGSVSMCAWVYFTGGSGYKSIMAKRNDSLGSPYAYGINFLPSTNMQVYTSGSSGVSTFDYVLPQNTWTHICGTMSANPTALYVNGVLYNTLGTGGGVVSNSAIFTIGADINGGGSPTEFFPGKIDDVRLYNRVLSASEVKQLYNMGR